MEVAVKAYEWPRRMVDVMKEATAKVTAEHKEFEAQLKARRRDFGELLEGYTRELDGYAHKSEMVKRDQIAAEVGPSGTVGDGEWGKRWFAHALRGCALPFLPF